MHQRCTICLSCIRIHSSLPGPRMPIEVLELLLSSHPACSQLLPQPSLYVSASCLLSTLLSRQVERVPSARANLQHSPPPCRLLLLALMKQLLFIWICI